MYIQYVYLYPLFTRVIAYLQDIFRIFVLSIFYIRHVVRTGWHVLSVRKSLFIGGNPTQ